MNLSPRKRRCCYLDQEVVGHPRNEPWRNASTFPGWRDGGGNGVAGPTAELGSPGSGEERCSGPAGTVPGWAGPGCPLGSSTGTSGEQLAPRACRVLLYAHGSLGRAC